MLHLKSRFIKLYIEDIENIWTDHNYYYYYYYFYFEVFDSLNQVCYKQSVDYKVTFNI